MKRYVSSLIVICAVVALILSNAVTVLAQQSNQAAGRKPTATAPGAFVNFQTPASCSICYTCGGDWPVYGGYSRSWGDHPQERGSGCAGVIRDSGGFSSDSSPFLCCN